MCKHITLKIQRNIVFYIDVNGIHFHTFSHFDRVIHTIALVSTVHTAT